MGVRLRKNKQHSAIERQRIPVHQTKITRFGRCRDLDFNTASPIFDYKGKEYIVSSSKECRIWLLDTGAAASMILMVLTVVFTLYYTRKAGFSEELIV